MTDIVERLRTQGVMDENCCPQCGAADTDQIDWLMCEAADEIERLRGLASYLTEERRRLRVEAGYD